MVNLKQNIVIVDIDINNLISFQENIQTFLNQGFIIYRIILLAPTKLLVVYYIPPVIPEIPI